MANPSEWPWPEFLDALTAAPEHHKLLFENERLRVLETIIPARARTPVHTHRWPSILYTQTAGDFRRYDGDGKLLSDSRQGPQPPPRIVEIGPMPPHSVENVGDITIQLINLEFKEGA